MQKKILLQNRSTKAYFCDHGWSESPVLARGFESPYHALYFCVSKELEDIDIMFRMPNQEEVRFLRC